jgi:tetratricopeptide (TPR) repeat protein
MHMVREHTDFSRTVRNATSALRVRDIPRARTAIADAMAQNMDAPEPHNLLGLLYELTGDFQAARRHYRAGYALDPTYKPCCRNLERLTGFESSAFLSGRAFGDTPTDAQAAVLADEDEQHGTVE